MNRTDAIREFEDDRCGKSMGDDEFLETLEEFVDRGNTALVARQEEIENEGEGNESESG